MAVLGSDNITHSAAFKFNINSADRVTIDSSGRLLVGTSTSLSGSRLQVAAATTGGQASSSINSFGASSQLRLDRAGTNTTAVVNNNFLGSVEYRGYDGTNYIAAASIEARVDGSPGTNNMPGRILFSTTPAGASGTLERMRITSAGNVLIGTTTPIEPTSGTSAGITIDPLGSIISSRNGASSLRLRRRVSNGFLAAFYRNTTLVGAISVTTTNTSYLTSSDYRLKENVIPLTGAIDRLQQIPVHRFNFIADPDTVVDGFIAHEAQEVVPECVTGTKDEVDADGNPVYQGIDQSKLVPLLTAALQEAIAKIEILEEKVASLEAS
jgi:hypothetical protein